MSTRGSLVLLTLRVLAMLLAVVTPTVPMLVPRPRVIVACVLLGALSASVTSGVLRFLGTVTSGLDVKTCGLRTRFVLTRLCNAMILHFMLLSAWTAAMLDLSNAAVPRSMAVVTHGPFNGERVNAVITCRFPGAVSPGPSGPFRENRRARVPTSFGTMTPLALLRQRHLVGTSALTSGVIRLTCLLVLIMTATPCSTALVPLLAMTAVRVNVNGLITGPRDNTTVGIFLRSRPNRL